MHLTGSSRTHRRPPGVSDTQGAPIADSLSTGDLRFLAHLMQFPRVVIAHRGPWVGVRGGLLDVTQGDPASSAAVMNACLSVCGMTALPCPTRRAVYHLAALAGDRQGPVPAFQAQVLDVGAGGLRDPQPVQREQRDQRMLAWRPETGCDQQSAELVAVQGDGMRLIIHPRPPDMGCWRVLEEFLFNGVLEEPAMVDSRRVTVARARPRASISRAKHSMSPRRTANRTRERARHQVVNWR